MTHLRDDFVGNNNKIVTKGYAEGSYYINYLATKLHYHTRTLNKLIQTTIVYLLQTTNKGFYIFINRY